MAIDNAAPISLLKNELDTTSHRPYCSGFYLGDSSALAPDTGGYVRDWTFIAIALEPSKDGYVSIQTRNYFRVGDTLEVVSPGKIGKPFIVAQMIDAERKEQTVSNTPMRVFRINAPQGILPGDLFRKRRAVL